MIEDNITEIFKEILSNEKCFDIYEQLTMN